MFKRQTVAWSREQGADQKKTKKISRSNLPEIQQDGFIASGLTARQQSVLRMQQTQGNAAVRRMLGQVVQRDDDDNQTNVSDAGVAYTSVQDSDASDTNVISVSTSSGDESSSDGGVIAGAPSADVSDAGENDQNADSSATDFGTGPALSFFDNTPMGVLKPRTKIFHSSSEEGYTLNKIHDQFTVSAGEDVVNCARSQVGSVIDNQPGEVDPDTQKPTRYGWRNLDKYYTSAYGGKDGKYDQSLQHNVKFFNGQHLRAHKSIASRNQAARG